MVGIISKIMFMAGEELENDCNYRLDVIVVDHDGGHYFKDYVYGWNYPFLNK
jgi:hypothetical protein